MYEFDNLIAVATMHTFDVPGIGTVTVEIGDGATDRAGRTYPAYRVSVGDVVLAKGADWGVPAGEVTDSEASALSLLSLVANDTDTNAHWTNVDADALADWVFERRDGIQS